MKTSILQTFMVSGLLVLIATFTSCIQVKFIDQDFSGEWIQFNILTQTPKPPTTFSNQPNTPIPTKSNTILPSRTPTILIPSHTPEPSTWEQGKLAYIQSFQGKMSLFTMDLASEGRPELIVSPPDGERFMAPQWAPDSRQIAYVIYPARSLILTEPTPGSLQKNFGECLHPSWSPDGAEILCQSAGYLRILDVESGLNKPMIQIEEGFVPSWSPAGDEVVYAIFDEDKTSIWKSGLDKYLPVPLAGEASENYAPAWSHDGQRIAYQSTMGSELSEIWVMDQEGQNPRRITFSPDGCWSRGPTWSPDDKWLAFVRGERGGDLGEIFIISIDGGELIKVTNTNNQVYDWRVSWGG